MTMILALAVLAIAVTPPAGALANAAALVVQFGHGDGTSTVGCSPDGRYYATGSGDETVKLWDASSGQLIRDLVGHNDEVESLGFSPDSTMLVTGSQDKTVKIWDVATGKLRQTLPADMVVHSVRKAHRADSLVMSRQDAKHVSCGNIPELEIVLPTAWGVVHIVGARWPESCYPDWW